MRYVPCLVGARGKAYHSCRLTASSSEQIRRHSAHRRRHPAQHSPAAPSTAICKEVAVCWANPCSIAWSTCEADLSVCAGCVSVRGEVHSCVLRQLCVIVLNIVRGFQGGVSRGWLLCPGSRWMGWHHVCSMRPVNVPPVQERICFVMMHHITNEGMVQDCTHASAGVL